MTINDSSESIDLASTEFDQQETTYPPIAPFYTSNSVVDFSVTSEAEAFVGGALATSSSDFDGSGSSGAGHGFDGAAGGFEDADGFVAEPWQDSPSWGSVQVDPEWSNDSQLEQVFSTWIAGNPLARTDAEKKFLSHGWDAASVFPSTSDDSWLNHNSEPSQIDDNGPYIWDVPSVSSVGHTFDPDWPTNPEVSFGYGEGPETDSAESNVDANDLFGESSDPTDDEIRPDELQIEPAPYEGSVLYESALYEPAPYEGSVLYESALYEPAPYEDFALFAAVQASSLESPAPSDELTLDTPIIGVDPIPQHSDADSPPRQLVKIIDSISTPAAPEIRSEQRAIADWASDAPFDAQSIVSSEDTHSEASTGSLIADDTSSPFQQAEVDPWLSLIGESSVSREPFRKNRTPGHSPNLHEVIPSTQQQPIQYRHLEDPGQPPIPIQQSQIEQAAFPVQPGVGIPPSPLFQAGYHYPQPIMTAAPMPVAYMWPTPIYAPQMPIGYSATGQPIMLPSQMAFPNDPYSSHPGIPGTAPSLMTANAYAPDDILPVQPSPAAFPAAFPADETAEGQSTQSRGHSSATIESTDKIEQESAGPLTTQTNSALSATSATEDQSGHPRATGETETLQSELADNRANGNPTQIEPEDTDLISSDHDSGPENTLEANARRPQWPWDDKLDEAEVEPAIPPEDPFIVISSSTYMVEFTNAFTVAVEAADEVIGADPWESPSPRLPGRPQLFTMVAGQVRLTEETMVTLGANEVEPPEPQIYSWASEPVVVEEVEEVPDLTREPMRINGWTVVSASNDILPSLDDTVSKKKRVRSR